jgi:hypothetical protein
MIAARRQAHRSRRRNRQASGAVTTACKSRLGEIRICGKLLIALFGRRFGRRGITEPDALSQNLGAHDRMFEQHDRWLEELLEYTNQKEAVTCRSDYMPLTAIAQEITTACADARVHDHMQIDSWESMAADLSDSLDWIGPNLLALVDTAARRVHHAITNDLLVPRPPNPRPRIDDTKRPIVAAQTAALAAVLDRDDVLGAAWRDLVAGCRDINHALYPSERIAFLRDTLVGRIPQAGSPVFQPYLDRRTSPDRLPDQRAAGASDGRRPRRQRAVQPTRKG